MKSCRTGLIKLTLTLENFNPFCTLENFNPIFNQYSESLLCYRYNTVYSCIAIFLSPIGHLSFLISDVDSKNQGSFTPPIFSTQKYRLWQNLVLNSLALQVTFTVGNGQRSSVKEKKNATTKLVSGYFYITNQLLLAS